MVPRYLEERDVRHDEDEANDAIPTIVVCSGDLVEQVCQTLISKFFPFTLRR